MYWLLHYHSYDKKFLNIWLPHVNLGNEVGKDIYTTESLITFVLIK